MVKCKVKCNGKRTRTLDRDLSTVHCRLRPIPLGLAISASYSEIAFYLYCVDIFLSDKVKP